jgi:uncharacterized Zn finger protein
MPPLSLDLLKAQSLPQTFERGKAYFQQGKVVQLISYGKVCESQVQGSQPYHQAFDLRGERFRASCDCPYSGKGLCKHQVAVGLALLAGAISEVRAPEQQPPLSFEEVGQLKRILLSASRPDQAQAAGFEEALEEGAFLDAMKWVLASYEAEKSLPTRQLAQLQQFPFRFPMAKAMIRLLFARWQAYQAAFQPLKEAFQYELERFIPFFQHLSQEAVPARYLQTQLQGYGLTQGPWADLLLSLKNRLG